MVNLQDEEQTEEKRQMESSTYLLTASLLDMNEIIWHLGNITARHFILQFLHLELLALRVSNSLFGIALCTAGCSAMFLLPLTTAKTPSLYTLTANESKYQSIRLDPLGDRTCLSGSQYCGKAASATAPILESHEEWFCCNSCFTSSSLTTA